MTLWDPPLWRLAWHRQLSVSDQLQQRWNARVLLLLTIYQLVDVVPDLFSNVLDMLISLPQVIRCSLIGYFALVSPFPRFKSSPT